MIALDTNYFGNSILDYMIFFGIILASLLIGRIIYYISKQIVRVRAGKTKTKFDDIIVDVMEKPLVFLIFIIGLYYATGFLTLSDRMAEITANVVKILLTIDVFWFVIYFIDSLLVTYVAPMASKTDNDIDDVLLPILRKVAKVILVIMAVIVIIDNFGYDITSILAGLGIGGLAFALAAKDMLANLFGGATILTDKPFKLGDRIKVAGYDGWVKQIGMRSTRVMTLDGFLMIIPNSIVANSAIENVSEEDKRKVVMTIGVEYSTSQAKMKKAKQIIERIVKKNKDTEDDSIISFTEFADSSLNFLVIYWIKNLDNILGAKHEINMEIKKEFEKAKISMAFPTRTVHVKK